MSHNGICNVKECLWNGREHPKGDLSAPDPMSTKKEKCNHDEFVRGQVGEECLECGLLRSTIDNIGSHSQSESEWENEFDEKFTGLAWHTNPMDGKLKSFIENLLEQERIRLNAEANAMIFEDLPEKAPDVKDQETLDDAMVHFKKVGSNHAVRSLLSIINK